MSNWTHIIGTIRVSPMGRCINEQEYILKQVVNHLPKVTGSEGDMDVHIYQDDYVCGYSNHDEYGQHSNLSEEDWFEDSKDFYLFVDADLRDRNMKITNREFQRWLCRLSKRVSIFDICVKIVEDMNEQMLVLSDANKYDFFEGPSWWNGEINWCEHLMYDVDEFSRYPKKLDKKYNRQETE